jgi:hypothetical protein
VKAETVESGSGYLRLVEHTVLEDERLRVYDLAVYGRSRSTRMRA